MSSAKDCASLAESALLTRKFAQALTISNDALSQYCCSRIKDESGRNTSEHNHPTDDGNSCIEVTTPLCLIELIEEGEYDVDELRTDRQHYRPWRISLGRKVSSRSRLAAVALQSCRELFSISIKNTQSTRPRRYRRILSGIRPFRMTYSGTLSNRETMPLELAIVWIKFCRSIGCAVTSAILGMEIVSKIISNQNVNALSNQHPETEWFKDCFVDLTRISLVETLACMKDVTFVEKVLECTFEEGSDFATTFRLECMAYIPVGRVPQSKSMIAISDYMNRWSDGHGNICDESFREIIERVLRNAFSSIRQSDDMERIETKAIKSDGSPCDTILSNEKSEDDEKSNDYDDDDDDKEESTQSSKKSWLLMQIQSSIVDPLFTAESRWANRARVVAAIGIVAFVTWSSSRRRRRTHFLGVDRFTRKAARDPINEFVSTLSG